MYNIPSVVFPVAQFFLEDVLQMTRFDHTWICIYHTNFSFESSRSTCAF